MKDTKTVLPAVNGNGDNKNGYHSKQKNAEHDNEDLPTEQLKKTNEENEELVGGCCVCSDDQGFANNALVYCDGKGCTVACHTACYGIVTIPDGNWYCDRCEADDIRAMCRLCPTIEGAMKRTSNGGWAHVVCALYIPEVSFGNNATMEPIVLSKVPSNRYGQECSICVENGRSKLISSTGACCSCTVKNCSKVFHVTCAQANGLLCEDVRKNNCQYPIYCEQHRPKLSKFIRQIAAFPYSPSSLATNEQIIRQNSLQKEKETPAQLSDFLSAGGTENNVTVSSSTSDESNNQSIHSDEQQTPVPRSTQTPDVLPRKSSSFNNNNSSMSSSTSISPVVQHKSHSRSSSTSSSSNSSSHKKVKTTDENSSNNNSTNQSLNDLSQFVQLSREERNFLPPPVPPSISHDKDESTKIESRESNASLAEEKLHTSRFTAPPSSESNPKSTIIIKQRHSTDVISASMKNSSQKKSISSTNKSDEHDEDFLLNKKRKISIKFNKDGQPRKHRQQSADGTGGRPVGRPPSKKNLTSQQMTNGLKRPAPKLSLNPTGNNMKRSKFNETLITMQQNSSELDRENETKIKSRSTTYHPCDHFGNQINSDVYQQRANLHEQISPVDTLKESSRTRTPSATAVPKIEFYPRRPLRDTSTVPGSNETQQQQQQQQRTFPPQTLEEFLEQEWELSSDFLLQQTMPHDVSSLLSCLYQFKSENAALQKKFDELRHRRDSLRVTNANLRRRLTEILPINESLPTASTSHVTQISPPVITTAAPPPAPTTNINLPPTTTNSNSVVPAVSPSPRKEQQQLKHQKLLAELDFQQQLQQQKATSPTRRRLSSNTGNAHSEPTAHSTIHIKKSKSPRQSNPLTQQSILENQLRQSAMINSSTKKTSTSSSTNSSSSTVKKPSADIELHGHHATATTALNSLPSSGTTSSSALPFEQIDAATTAAAAYALAKSGRPTNSPSLSLDLFTQILTASGNTIAPQLFAPTWNISNFGYANFPTANPLSITDETHLRPYAPTTIEHQQQQPSTKPQP